MDYGDHRLFLYEDAVDLVVTTNSFYVDNRPMNNKSLIAHKGLTNTIKFNIRNRDRKLQSVFADELVAYLVNPATKKRLVTKRLENTSDVGIVKLYLTKGDIQDIDAGLYKIYITRTNSEGVDLPIYSNQNNDISFDIEISGQAVFDPVPTQVDESLTQVSANVYASSALFGNLDRNFNHAQHSVAIHPSTYTGNVKVQASCLLGAPGSDDASNDWFDVTGNIALTSDSNVFCRSFKVNANWVRVLSYPDDANSSITKVQLRN